ncbi:hypothetical protein BQ8482_160011 [Mesorhizobium delmotii]|uniref:Uncharacterized protein n=1 Tax=Mesorhizobium delmotii TaxID=1631247 RepID=A0A2P9AHB7_9HYPH|nr:hypothetical protein BQ8482_160011 [Mesorhizobium delmotii]
MKLPISPLAGEMSGRTEGVCRIASPSLLDVFHPTCRKVRYDSPTGRRDSTPLCPARSFIDFS